MASGLVASVSADGVVLHAAATARIRIADNRRIVVGIFSLLRPSERATGKLTSGHDQVKIQLPVVGRRTVAALSYCRDCRFIWTETRTR
jgi:hypothetical protein